MRKAVLFLFAVAIVALGCEVISAQTTEFTYQGSLRDGAGAANGNYDFEFALFDAASGGAQLGSTLTRSPVAVTNGIFAVQLDFGSQFPGAGRFLEIRLRPTGNPGGYQQLLPRQAVNSSPYSVRSLNSTTADSATNATTANNSLQLGGVGANEFVVTTDPRMTDSRSPTAGSGNYIQNQNAGAQATSNFNISGNGTAGGTLSGGVVNAATEYRIGGNRILGNSGAGNTFAGIGSGSVNSTGINNTFVGTSAGQANTGGPDNSFFGRSAGSSNTTGGGNSFFGVLAGGSNSTGTGNSFFGGNAGNSNSTGGSNTFVGSHAGESNTTASNNSFFGRKAGVSNTTGFNNTFVGANAGQANSTGLDNSFFGRTAGFSNTTGGNNSFFGSLTGNSNTTGSSNSFFGGNAGNANTTASNNSFFGAGSGSATTTGGANSFFGSSSGNNTTTGVANSGFGQFADLFVTTGNWNASFGASAGHHITTGNGNSFVGTSSGFTNVTGDYNSALGYAADVSSDALSYATAIGAYSSASISNSIYLGRPGGEDTVRVPGNLNVTGNTSLNGNLTFASGGIASISSANLFMTQLPAGTGTTLCRTASNQIVTCSSSLRYKTNVNRFGFGLDLINRLKPITFDWKEGGTHDFGLGAEDVAAIEPLLVTYNDKGEVEGVKYDRLGVVLVNAIKEQQKTIETQQRQIDELKKIICLTNKDADLCKE